LDKLKNI